MKNGFHIEIDENLRRKMIANEIVKSIVKERSGQIYDEDILQQFTNQYVGLELEEIKNLVDEMMSEYLEDGNLIVKEGY